MPSPKHVEILDSLKLRTDDVIIFVLNNENSSAADLGFTQASEVWETAGFVSAASSLVSAIEVVLGDGMREGVGNFEENIMRMLGEGEEMRRRAGEGFSDSSDSEEEEDEDYDIEEEDEEEGHFEDERGGKGEEGEPIGLTPYKKDRRATLREAAGYYRENEGSESRFSPIITSDYFGDSSNENEKVRLNFTTSEEDKV